MDMKKILQALDGASTKPVEGSNDIKKFLQVVSEETAMPPAVPAQQSPEQIAYNQLRAQLDSLDALKGTGSGTTYSYADPQTVAAQNNMRQKLAQMAAALKAKGIDAEAEYNAPDPTVPAAAPVDLKKYNDQDAVAENVGMSRLLSIISEGKGPLNRATSAESLTMQHYTTTRKTITSPVLNVAEGAKTSMIGKYFKAVEQEIAESNERSKDRARQLAERVIERVTIGPDGQVTGGLKPAAQDTSAPTAPTAPSEPPATLPGAGMPKAEKADRTTQTVTVGGQEYEMVWLEPGGVRPRGGQKFSLPMAMLGIRGIGNYIGVIAGGKAYMLPKGEQESIQEQYTYKDIAEMARLGYSDLEIAEHLGFDLT